MVGIPIAVGSDGFQTSATQVHALGTLGFTKDGRIYRYCKAGLVDLVAGNVIQSPAITPNHLGAVSPAVALGAVAFTFTPGGTLGTANQYAEGYLQVDTTPGNGYVYGVSGHPAFATSTAFPLTLKLDDPIQVALTSSSRLGLLMNPWNGVIQSPITTATGLVVGVAPYIVSASQYGWIQVSGMASALVNGTPALGTIVIGTSGTTAGAVDVATAAPLLTGQAIGAMAQIGVSGKNNFVFLRGLL
jgi:hypothetical protein